MGDLQRIDDLPGSFGYGAGVLYGLPQPPRWMGEVNPDLQKVILLLDSGELLFGHLTGLDWEGGNVLLRSGEIMHSNPIGDLRGILLSADTEGRAVAPPQSVRSTLRYRDGGEWTLHAHTASADLFGAGFFAVADGELHAIFVPWRALADNRLSVESGLDDHRRARLQREVAFRRGAEIDRLRMASLNLVSEPGRQAADIRRSAYAKAFCEALGG
ncbi:hypothetical protein [Arenimonas sp. MALMAid1274]|uniref:hypothetical protein n=1 Tax=Arenimonas sp. MALMAid1274 TaxID=3411630 RepID=UPI003B9FF8DD